MKQSNMFRPYFEVVGERPTETEFPRIQCSSFTLAQPPALLLANLGQAFTSNKLPITLKDTVH